jgi:prepilin-type N-terminal cleavage/methylation domain-containing protein
LKRAHGFTLIEMLAVIAIFGLIAAMVVPNLDLGGSRAVRADASDFAAAVEFTRQRSVMTGRAHVLHVDVANAAHWVTWAAPPEPVPPPAPGAQRILQLVPPDLEVEHFVPVPGEFGRPRATDDGVVIVGVEVAEGLAQDGIVELRMNGDGSSDPAAVLFSDADGNYALRVEIEPLSDLVRVVHAE